MTSLILVGTTSEGVVTQIKHFQDDTYPVGADEITTFKIDSGLSYDKWPWIPLKTLVRLVKRFKNLQKLELLNVCISIDGAAEGHVDKLANVAEVELRNVHFQNDGALAERWGFFSAFALAKIDIINMTSHDISFTFSNRKHQA